MALHRFWEDKRLFHISSVCTFETCALSGLLKLIFWFNFWQKEPNLHFPKLLPDVINAVNANFNISFQEGKMLMQVHPWISI